MVLKFPLLVENGSLQNLFLLDAIVNFKNLKAVRSPIIKYIVTMQFKSTRPWVLIFTVLLCINIILIMFLIGLHNSEVYLVAPFLLVNILLIAWEVVQIFTDPKGYLRDYQNWMDIIRISASLTWIILDSYGIFSLYFDWVAAFINIVRGISVFILFDGTRFYIQLIFRSLNDIKYFFLMFAYSTFGFGCLLMISSDEELAFTSIWGDSYDMSFGSYQDPGTGDYSLKYIVYFGVTMINVVLMLNLLISILGDSYHAFQIEQMVVDIHLKAKISRELQTMMFWADNRSILKCIRLCNYAFVEEEDEN